MATPLELDLDLIQFAGISIDVVGTSISGGISTVGNLQDNVDYSYGGLLSIKFTRLRIDTRKQHLYWNMLARRLSGGIRSITVPIKNNRLMISGITGSVNGAVSAKANSLSFRIIDGPSLVGGEWFSIKHSVITGWRTYGISEITDVADEGSGSILYTATIAPHIRVDVADSTELEFSEPKCLMRLPQNDNMIWKVNLPQISRLDLALIEEKW